MDSASWAGITNLGRSILEMVGEEGEGRKWRFAGIGGDEGREER